MTTTTHTRVALRFDGELDDVPIAAAAAVADMAHALLLHSDEHAGRSAAMRLHWALLLADEGGPTCLVAR